jgi:hypothetical protein
MVRLKDADGRTAMDKVWVELSIALDIKMGHFQFSKPSRSSRANACEVTSFNYSMTEVAKKCLEDDPTLAKIGERLL